MNSSVGKPNIKKDAFNKDSLRTDFNKQLQWELSKLRSLVNNGGGGQLTITDDILKWDSVGNKYIPYTTKKAINPLYPYFYTNNGIDAPTFNNILMLDGILYSTSLVTQSGVGTGLRSASLQPSSLLLYTAGGAPIASSFNIDVEIGTARIYSQKADGSCIPIQIGSVSVFPIQNGEYITIDDLNRLFNINMTTIKLSKGVANTWLGLNADREIIYNTAPSQLVPVDDILDWNGSKYIPYANKLVADPGFPYFYIGNSIPTYSGNKLVLDGTFHAVSLNAYSFNNRYSSTLSSGGLVFNLDYLTFTTNAQIAPTLNYELNILNERTDVLRSSPIIIGDLRNTGDYHGEYIKIDDYNRLFDINTTTIKLSKGTANTWLGLNANNEIVYNTTPTTLVPDDGIFDWDGSKYTPYAAKKAVDPVYAYFYNGISIPTFTNRVNIDGIVAATSFNTFAGTAFSYFDPGVISLGQDSTHTLSIATYLNRAKISTGDGYEILIGNANYISIKEALDLFTIDMTTIKLSKGTASKWLALNASKEIVYLDAPSGGTGTVTSVGLALPTEFNISNSPVTGQGILTAAWNTVSPATVLMGAVTGGGMTVPSFRALVASDLPAAYDGFGSWDLGVNADAAIAIHKSGSVDTYAGVRIKEGTGIDVTSQSNMDGFFEVTIATTSSGVTIMQIPNVTLTAANWYTSLGILEYYYYNVNIAATDIVEVIPDNASISIVKLADVLPRTDSSLEHLKLYCLNVPSGDIIVTLNIYKS